MVTLAALLFEDQHFVTFQMALNRGIHGCALDCGGANGHFGPVVDEKDLIKADLVSFFVLQTVHVEPLILLYLILVPCNFYDGVHNVPLFLRGAKVRDFGQG